MSLESIIQITCRAPTSLSNISLARIASYSTWLFDVLNAKGRDFSSNIWLDPSRTMLAPAPFGLEDPSTYKVHKSYPSMTASYKSLEKSAIHWSFIDPRGSYWMAKIALYSACLFKILNASVEIFPRIFGWVLLVQCQHLLLLSGKIPQHIRSTNHLPTCVLHASCSKNCPDIRLLSVPRVIANS